MTHQTGVVDTLSVDDVKTVLERIAADHRLHALGDIKKSDIEPAKTIADWNPTFALVHILHFVIEDLQRLPTFWEVRDHPLFRELLFWREANQAVAESVQVDGVSEAKAKQAMQWRVGLAYYSVMREQWVAAVWREAGLDIRQHPLADALFRTDLWVGNTNLDIYIANPGYRGPGRVGRKIGSDDRFSDANPPFVNLTIMLPRGHTYGDVHLPSEGQLKGLLDKFSSS